MPGRASAAGDSTAIVPFTPTSPVPFRRAINHGLRPPIGRVFISWGRGNLLHVAVLSASKSGDGVVGGKVVEVNLGGGEEEGGIDEARRRRIAYGSVPAFSMLQTRKNSLNALGKVNSLSVSTEWWQYVLEYSRQITELLGEARVTPLPLIEDPKLILLHTEEPISLKAAWLLMEIFYVDRLSSLWLPERLVDWLADYDSILSRAEATTHSKLVILQKKLVDIQVVEDDPEYWDGISSALAIGWLDTVVKLLRLHGSYQIDQLGSRETENGLVEAVVYIVSTMPRMRSELPEGKLGQCYKTKPDFIKAWEKWRDHITKLESSAFWVQCGHRQTREGLKNCLHIMLGSINHLTSTTCHWMELYISHFLYIRPFTTGLDGMNTLAQKCMQLKPASSSNGLLGLLVSILGDNIEVVLANCSKEFGPWMVTHSIELLTCRNDQAALLLLEERHNLGGVSIEELHRLVYAQVLCSHPSTWQITPPYLASCPKQGLGLLEIVLYKQPVQHYQMILKNLEFCRLYELENIMSCVMKIAGIYHWKHGRKGSGIYWLQQASDEFRLNIISQQLFDCIGKSISDNDFKQWEGLIELLGSKVGSAGGLEFLHKYRDFKRTLKEVQDGRATDAARKTMECLIQLMKSPSTPERFWLPLLHDSVRLLNWKDRPLLNVMETNLLLNKLQELSMAKLRPGFCDNSLPPQALSSVRLALAHNLGRAILEEC